MVAAITAACAEPSGDDGFAAGDGKGDSRQARFVEDWSSGELRVAGTAELDGEFRVSLESPLRYRVAGPLRVVTPRTANIATAVSAEDPDPLAAMVVFVKMKGESQWRPITTFRARRGIGVTDTYSTALVTSFEYQPATDQIRYQTQGTGGWFQSADEPLSAHSDSNGQLSGTPEQFGLFPAPMRLLGSEGTWPYRLSVRCNNVACP